MSVKYPNFKQHRSVENLIGSQASFVTIAGIFRGTITTISDDYEVYSLSEVIFTPTGQLGVKLRMECCEVFARHIIASLPVGEWTTEET